jgi:hypothetical protein
LLEFAVSKSIAVKSKGTSPLSPEPPTSRGSHAVGSDHGRS